MSSLEQSIKIKDLSYAVLRVWRQLIVCALVGAILLLGITLYRGTKTVEPLEPEIRLSDEEVTALTQQSMEEDQRILEAKEKLESLVGKEASLNSQLENRPYLSINDKSQPKTVFDVVVVPEHPLPESDDTFDQRRYFLSLDYLKITKGDALVGFLAKQCLKETEHQWIRELLSYELNEDRSLHVEVIAPQMKAVRCLSESAQKFFKETIREYLSVNYLFDVEIANLATFTEPNPEIKKERDLLEKELKEVQEKIADSEEAIEKRIQEILDEALEEKIEKKKAEDEAKPKVSLTRTAVKYGIAGALIGILLAAFVAIFRTTSSAVIWSPEEFADQLKVLYLGSIVSEVPDSDKKARSGIDRWLEKIFYGRKKSTDADGSVAYVTSIIEGLERKEDAGAQYVVAVLGDAGEPSLERMTDSIGSIAGLKGIQVLANTAEGIKDLRSAGAAIQLVRARQTSLKKAVRDLELAANMGVKILGIVGVDRF